MATSYVILGASITTIILAVHRPGSSAAWQYMMRMDFAKNVWDRLKTLTIPRHDSPMWLAPIRMIQHKEARFEGSRMQKSCPSFAIAVF